MKVKAIKVLIVRDEDYLSHGKELDNSCGTSMVPVAVSGPSLAPDLQLAAVAMATAASTWVTDHRAAMAF